MQKVEGPQDDSPSHRAVLYAAKSTEDNGSIATQLADCRALAEREGLEVSDEYSDENASAWSGDRGPQLAAALDHAEQIGGALIVQHSDRLARGDGKRARHLVELYFEASRAGVTLRSVQDASTFDSPLLSAVMGERNAEDSRRKSEAVKSGKRRQFEKGEPLGGKLPDGYVKVDGAIALDPERAQVIARAFELADGGFAPANVARQLNAEGHVTKGGGAFDRRRIQDTLSNPFYAGRIARGRATPGAEVETTQGTHPALIDPDTFDRIQLDTAGRDRAAGSKREGRPNTRHVFARLGECARCARAGRFGRMYARTSTYRRKDGSRKRTYHCQHAFNGTGLCDAPPVDAAVAEAAFLDHLQHFYLDADSWLEAKTDEHRSARMRIEAAIDRERDELARLDRLTGKLEAEYLARVEAGKPSEAAHRALEGMPVRHGQARHRLSELEATLEATPERPNADPLLDLYADLSKVLRGLDTDGRTVVEVNAQLRQVIDSIEFDPLPDGAVKLVAYLSNEFVRAKGGAHPDDLAIAEFRGIPPVKPVLAPSQKVATAQE
jgi:DNA invertase Pin-like site-specific DNA recombinase